MIHRVSGTLLSTDDRRVIIDVHGMGLAVASSARTLGVLPQPGEPVELFTHLHVKEDALDLYGFRTEAELRFFNQLISVSGVGPRSALAILDVGDLKDLAAAIKENRPDLLTQASGIGRKTAERIIIELRNKVDVGESVAAVKRMDADGDILETLVGLGYRREEARAALGNVDPKMTALEARLKSALAILSNRNR